MLAAGSQLGYDGVKTYAKAHGISDAPTLHVGASVVAAFLASAFAAPADVVMTQYQTAPQRGVHYNSVAECAVMVLREGGPMGFFRGWSMQFGRIAPLFCINMPLYEQIRTLAGLGFMD
jgi:hypothetical protein